MSKKGITRKRNGLILQELFKVFLEHPDGVRAKEAIEKVAARMTLTEHEKGEYETGGRRQTISSATQADLLSGTDIVIAQLEVFGKGCQEPTVPVSKIKDAAWLKHKKGDRFYFS